MQKVFMAGVAAISMTVMPAMVIAQATPGAPASNDAAAGMTAEQQTAYDSWAVDRKADYDTWTAAQKSFFWGLDSQKQTGYWALTPDQRTQIAGLTPAQQAEAWASIAAQLSGQAATPPVPIAPASASAPASTMPASSPAPTGGGNTQFVSNATVQGGMTTPTPKAEYPVCKGDVQDGCINRGGK